MRPQKALPSSGITAFLLFASYKSIQLAINPPITDGSCPDEEKITQDDRYLHHGGKPVLFVWGFLNDRFEAALAHRLIDFLKSDDRYGVTLVAGCQWQWQWRTVDEEGWARAFRRLDVISPWNVGNYAVSDGKKVAATHYWEEDLAEAEKHGREYLPVIYPGFGWTNLKGKDATKATIARRGGEFFKLPSKHTRDCLPTGIFG